MNCSPAWCFPGIADGGREYETISKPGGFGEEDLLVTLKGETEPLSQAQFAGA